MLRQSERGGVRLPLSHLIFGGHFKRRALKVDKVSSFERSSKPFFTKSLSSPKTTQLPHSKPDGQCRSTPVKLLHFKYRSKTKARAIGLFYIPDEKQGGTVPISPIVLRLYAKWTRVGPYIIPNPRIAATASIAPITGPSTGIHAYLQPESPLPATGRNVCASRGPRSRAGLIA